MQGGDPIAGVVFGRGRVLGVWNEARLDDQGIDEASLFLLGACSCRVKFQNPGWDLAMAVDWDTRLMAAQMVADREAESEEVEESEPEPESEPQEEESAAAPETVTFEAPPVPIPEPGSTAGLALPVVVAIVGGAVVLLAGAVFFLRRSS